MNILFILLGCNIYSLLLNRLVTSFKFIEENIHQYQSINYSYTNTTNQSLSLSNPTNPTQITWFLSGGIKNNFEGAKSEASLMKSQIDNFISLKYNTKVSKSNSHEYDNFVSKNRFDWDFILDEKSTNTAENFIWASQFLNTTTKPFDSVYVITSAFHYHRAKTMLNLIDPSRNFKWILGNKEEPDSRYWESIHINNVNSDVSKAKNKLMNFL